MGCGIFKAPVLGAWFGISCALIIFDFQAIQIWL